MKVRQTTGVAARRLAAAWFLAFAALLGPVCAQNTDRPTLRVETGMHLAGIARLGADAQGRYLVTGSMDKTVRVWDAASGVLLNTLRPPTGPGVRGMIYAVAISPDGQTVACGGATGPDGGPYSVYLFDRATGRMTRRLPGLPGIITDLSLSPDGRFLAAASARGGVRLFRLSDGKPAAQDTDYGDASYATAFHNSGTSLRLATTCFDGQVRLYDVGADGGLRLRTKRKAPGGGRPYGVAFSPDGSRLAVGFQDSTQVSVVSAQDLKPQYAPESPQARGATLPAVCWSADGRSLYAGGTVVAVSNADADAGKFALRRWDDGGRGHFTDIPVSLGATASLQPRPAGGVFYATVEPALGALDGGDRTLFAHAPNTAQTFFNTPPFLTAAGVGGGLLLSAQGETVGFAYEALGKSPASFSVPGRSLTLGKAGGLNAPLTAVDGLNVQGWAGTAAPTLNGRPLKLAPGEVSLSLAVAPDGQRLLLGTVAFIHCYDKDGQEQWKIPVQGAASIVNITSDGQVGVAQYGDGTLHWFRMRDGQELLTFFPDADQRRWVLWTPSGYYDASVGGEDLIGWQVGRGEDAASDFFSVGRFRAAYNRPDITGCIIATADEAEAVRMNAKGHPALPAGGVEAALPPVVTITSPETGSTVSAPTVTVHYTVRTPSGRAVTSLKVLVNGRPVQTTRDLHLVAAGDAPQEVTVPVPPQDCQVSLIASSGQAVSEPATVGLTRSGASAPAGGFVIKPKLYVLAVGVSHYQDASLTLGYSAKDAQDFARAMLGQKGRLYADVQERVLVDAKATRDGIVDGLEWIEKQTTQHDVAMVFLSGHGANDRDGNYVYIPVNFDMDHIKTTSVPFTDIKETVEGLAGKALFFVDTCHSGNVLGTAGSRDLKIADTDAAVNDLSSAENGAVVFTASTGRQVALEDKAWGNGAFTKAVLEGLGGLAAYGHDGRVTVNMLDLYVSDRVKVLTKGAQTPTTAKPQTVPDFPIALTTRTAAR
jgi:uncharacterized caspase-like protein